MTIGPNIGLAKGPYIGKVLGSELIDTFDNRWVYTVAVDRIEFAETTWDDDDTMALYDCLNLLEMGNTGEISMGITKSSLPGTFELKPIPNNTGVLLWLVGGVHGVFQAPNQFDGDC